MSEQEREFTVLATKTLTATFTVYAEDEEDARSQVETAAGFDFAVTCSDAVKLDADDWDVSEVEQKR